MLSDKMFQVTIILYNFAKFCINLPSTRQPNFTTQQIFSPIFLQRFSNNFFPTGLTPQCSKILRKVKKMSGMAWRMVMVNSRKNNKCSLSSLELSLLLKKTYKYHLVITVGQFSHHYRLINSAKNLSK